MQYQQSTYLRKVLLPNSGEVTRHFFSKFFSTRLIIVMTFDCVLDSKELTDGCLNKTLVELETSEQLKYLFNFI